MKNGQIENIGFLAIAHSEICLLTYSFLFFECRFWFPCTDALCRGVSPDSPMYCSLQPLQ